MNSSPQSPHVPAEPHTHNICLSHDSNTKLEVEFSYSRAQPSGPKAHITTLKKKKKKKLPAPWNIIRGIISIFVRKLSPPPSLCLCPGSLGTASQHGRRSWIPSKAQWFCWDVKIRVPNSWSTWTGQQREGSWAKGGLRSLCGGLKGTRMHIGRVRLPIA